MSLILKGIDLPKEDEVMVITVWGDDKDGTAFISNKEPMITVPINAIQIPQPHGRIKDVDNITAQEVFIDEMSFYAVDCDDIDDAPTILEAEE